MLAHFTPQGVDSYSTAVVGGTISGAVDLATVSLSESQAKLAQARQNVVVAEKTLAVAQDRFETTLRSAEIRAQELRARAERRKELLEKNLGTQEEYDAARTLAVQAEAELQSVRLQAEELKTQDLALEVKRQDVKLAEADVASDQIALANAKRRLEETKVSAPMDGVVSARTVQIGQIISSGITNVGGGTTILTLSDLSRVFVLAAVDESDIGQVTLDQPANISVDAFPGVRFRGKVVRIATKGVNLSNVVTFEVKIEVLSPNKTLLKPEMTANVQVVASQKDDVLVVPMQAISRKDEKLMATVSRPDGSTEDRPVEVGMTDGTNWEIVAGLSEGETVLAKKGEAESRWRAGGPRPMGGPFMMGGHGGGGGRSR